MSNILDFYAPAMSLANAGYLDALDNLWLGFSLNTKWTAGLSTEELAEFLAFPESIATTVLSAEVDERQQDHIEQVWNGKP